MKISDELWASDRWVPMPIEKHKWMRENLDEEHAVPGCIDAYFVPKGCSWPLVSVCIYPQYSSPPTGVLISVNYKEAPDGWFTKCSLPKALVPKLVEMLQAITEPAR